MILFTQVIVRYSETRPYGHLSDMVTSLLRPLFLAVWHNGLTFSCKKSPQFFGPIGDCINGVPLYMEKNLGITKPHYGEHINFCQCLGPLLY